MTNTDIDIALSIGCALTEEGDTWSSQEIADLCGCSYQYINDLERRALKKLQQVPMLGTYHQEF